MSDPVGATPAAQTLAVFGATGRTGAEIVSRALDYGLAVRALVRPGSTLAEPPGAVQVISGSLLSASDVERTVAGSDAVCCAFGARPPYRDIFCAAATRLVLGAMASRGVRRILCVTGAMIGDYPRNRTWVFARLAEQFRRRSPEAARDRELQEQALRDSGLDWTLVKPPRLTDRARSRYFEEGPELRLGLTAAVSRSDVAAFILREVVRPTRVGEAVFLRG